jgi:hypothetical protein
MDPREPLGSFLRPSLLTASVSPVVLLTATPGKHMLLLLAPIVPGNGPKLLPNGVPREAVRHVEPLLTLISILPLLPAVEVSPSRGQCFVNC